MSRSALRIAILLAIIVLAGCIADSGGGTATVSETERVTETDPVSETESVQETETETTADPDSEAKERAIEAEESYIVSHVTDDSCIVDWGYGGDGVTQATVENRTDNAVIVSVSVGYWIKEQTPGTPTAGAAVHIDSYSEARYRITESNTTRLSGTNLSDSDEQSC